jgi:hypothetical protein
MKVLVATDQTRGWRANDFCWTVEGELVFFPPLECAREHRRRLRLPALDGGFGEPARHDDDQRPQDQRVCHCGWRLEK